MSAARRICAAGGMNAARRMRAAGRARAVAPSWCLLSVVLFAAAGCSGSAEPKKETTAPTTEVTVVAPERRSVARTITLAAGLQAYEQAPLYAKVAGYVATIAVDIGDRVTEGQVLATLEVPEIAQQYAQAENKLAEQRAEVTKTEADAALRKVIFERSRGLRAKDAITEQDLDQARAESAKASAELRLAEARAKGGEARLAELRALMEYARLRAPFAGVVTQRFVDRGALVQAATLSSGVSPVVTVARIDTVRAVVDVPEPDVPFVDRADHAILEVVAIPGRRFEGQVSRFAGALDPGSRTMRTEVDFSNPDGTLVPGMYGSMTIAVDTHPDALTVPESAVRRKKDRAIVYVLDGERAVGRVIATGFAADGRVEILEGLTEQDRVIASGTAMSDGRPVKVVEAPRAGVTP